MQKEDELKDYKFFSFDGKVEFLFIASDKSSKNEETMFDFFDSDSNHLPFLNGTQIAKENTEARELRQDDRADRKIICEVSSS